MSKNKKELLNEKKKLLKEKKKKIKKEAKKIEKVILDDFDFKYKKGVFEGDNIVSYWTKDSTSSEFNLENKYNIYHITSELMDELNKRLDKKGIKQIWFNYAINFIIGKKKYEKLVKDKNNKDEVNYVKVLSKNMNDALYTYEKKYTNIY